MSIPPGLTSYSIRRSVVAYRARFAEPAFELLGNPAPLYTQLLRHLGKYGATLRSLSIDVSSLAEANVNCAVREELSGGVAVGGVNVMASLGDALELATAIEFTKELVAAVDATAPQLVYSSQTVANSLWGSAPDRTFAEIAERFLNQPDGVGFDGLTVASVAWDDQIGSTEFRVEESADRKGGIFVYSSSTFPPHDDLLGMSKRFKRQLADRLAAIGLYSEQFS